MHCRVYDRERYGDFENYTNPDHTSSERKILTLIPQTGLLYVSNVNGSDGDTSGPTMATRTTRSHTPELERKADNASQPSGSTRAARCHIGRVLMALLVMAIGVTSVFHLFPLAMLKSVKASQLTNAKL